MNQFRYTSYKPVSSEVNSQLDNQIDSKTLNKLDSDIDHKIENNDGVHKDINNAIKEIEKNSIDRLYNHMELFMDEFCINIQPGMLLLIYPTSLLMSLFNISI